MLQTPLGLLALQGGPDLPSGSTVLLRLATAPMPPPAPAPATAPDLPFAALSRALVTLPPALAAELGAVLPAIGDEAHPLALRLKALAEAAAGEEDPALADAGAAALLRHALDSQKSLVTLPGSGPDPWQCYLLPLMLDGTLRPLRLVMRERPRDARAKARRREEGTRFLMDLEMTRLGPMQFDGLVKAQAKRFDLIIRSHAALTRDLKDGITAVFTATLDGFGMSGLASFVHTPHFILPRPLGPENAPGAETFMA
ncbi:hypothetical protein GALL_443590 [mine drainage metagenome]|uniref:Uncharacterized protein n=1 Tax=mine drainage metagenome TaxID=410659 RepID=A0A1J5PT51_9ZZZZ